MNRRMFLQMLPTLPFLFVRSAAPESPAAVAQQVASSQEGGALPWAMPWAIPWEVGPSTLQQTYFPIVMQE